MQFLEVYTASSCVLCISIMIINCNNLKIRTLQNTVLRPSCMGHHNYTRKTVLASTHTHRNHGFTLVPAPLSSRYIICRSAANPDYVFTCAQNRIAFKRHMSCAILPFSPIVLFNCETKRAGSTTT